MNAGITASDLFHLPYRLLKQDSCYDKMDLFLRVNVAAFGSSDSFQKWQHTLAAIVDELRKGVASEKTQRAVKACLKHADFRLLPKSVDLTSAHQKPNTATGTKRYLISNKRIVET